MPQNLEGDAVRIKQVMLNYASNAIKYTESGQIDITVGCEEMQDGLVNLIYTVKDTGQGIREEDISKLFLMYSQLDQQINHGKEGIKRSSRQQFQKILKQSILTERRSSVRYAEADL